ncbi:MAG: cysteine synthase family protein [Planctomycetota bacterium]|jgi:cysteine synthase B|nr:cysteine synthase family protein [Planctomycetota bacterium]
MAVASILDKVGATPLLRLARLDPELSGVEVWAKAEFLNPSGSVKDRAAKSMIEDGIWTGRFAEGKILLDATSGNTGISYAMFCAALGRRAELCVPKNLSRGRKLVLEAYGAGLIETDPLLGSDGAQLKARELAGSFSDKYFYPDQYNNPENWKAHYRGTAEEIWAQTGGGITHFVAGTGSCGTFVGTVRRLKEFNSAVQGVVMQPDSPLHGLEGMRHLASSIVPGCYDSGLADAVVEASTGEARKTAAALARTEGLFVGVSSGANVSAALRLARRLPAGSLVVTVLCDSGFRYLDDGFWEEPLAPS